MNDLQVLSIVVDTIQDNLEDPMYQWTGKVRSYVHDDDPLVSATFPRIQVVKRGPTNNETISIGWNYLEDREVIIDIHFWTKIGFKWKDESGVYLKDDRLVTKYLHKIWEDAIKPQLQTIWQTHGIDGIKNIGEANMEYNPDTQKFHGILSVAARYFYR